MDLDAEKDRSGLLRKATDSDSGLGLTQPRGAWLSSSALPSSLSEWLPLRLHDLGGSGGVPTADAVSAAAAAVGVRQPPRLGASDDALGPDSSFIASHRRGNAAAAGATAAAQSTPRLRGGGDLGSGGGERPARWVGTLPSSDWPLAGGLTTSPAAAASAAFIGGPGSQGFAGQSSARDALAESESRRSVLLDKLKEAQETLRVQSARLAQAETAYHNATFEVEELKHREMMMKNKLVELDKMSRDQAKHRSDEVAIQAALRNQISEMEAAFQKFVSDYQLLEVDHGRRRELVEQLTTTIELVEDENRKLHKSQSELASDMRQTQQQIVALTEERKSLQTQLDSSKRDAAHWRQELDDCQRAQKSAEETVSELRIKAVTLSHKLESLEQSHDALHKEKLSSQQRERDLTEDITDLKSKLAILTSDKERSNQERAEMLRKVEGITASKAEAEKAVESLRSQLSAVSTELRIKQDLLGELQERYQRLQEENAASRKAAEKLAAEVTRLKELLDREQDEKLSLRRSTTRLTEDNAGLEEAVAKLKRENTTSKGETECLQAAYAQEKQKWDDAVDKLQATVRKLQKESTEQQEANTDLLSKLKQRETDSARQTSQLAEEVQQWRARHEAALASMQRKEDEVGIMAHRIKELEVEVSRLEAELHTHQMEFESSSQMREEMQRLQVLNKRLQMEKAENEQVVQLLQTQRDIYARSVNEHAARSHEIQSKADGIKLIEEDSMKNRIKAEELQKQLHILLNQKDELLSKAQAADDACLKARDEAAAAAERLAAAERRLQELQRDNAALSAELATCRNVARNDDGLAVVEQQQLRTRAEAAERLAAELRTQHEQELERRLRETAATAEVHARELAALRLERDALREHGARLEERSSVLLQSVRLQESTARSAEAEATARAAAAGCLEAERAALEERCRALEAELRAAAAATQRHRDANEATAHERGQTVALDNDDDKAPAAALRAALVEARKEAETYGAECARLRADAARAADLQRRLAEAERAVERLEAEAVAAAEREANLADRAAAERQAAVEELASAMASHDELQRACAELRAAATAMEAAGKAVGGGRGSRVFENAAGDEAATAATDPRRSRAGGGEDDLSELESLRALCEQQAADLALQEDVRTELRLVKEHCERLQRDLSAAAERDEPPPTAADGAELAALRDGKERARRDGEALAQRVDELEEALEKSAAAARSELRRRDEAIEDLEEETRRLEQRRERAAAEARRAQDELDEALEELQQARDAAERVLQEKATLALEKAAVQQEMAALALRCSAAEAKLVDRADSESKVTSLRSQLTALESQKNQAEVQVGRLQTELAILKRDTSAQMEEINRNNSENLSDLQSSAWQLREELRQAHDIQARQEDLINTLQEEISLLRKYEQESREIKEKLRLATEKCSSHVEAASIHELNRLLASRDEELQKLQQAVVKSSAELVMREEIIEKLQLRIQQLSEGSGHKESETVSGSRENGGENGNNPHSNNPHSVLTLTRRLEDGLRQQIIGCSSADHSGVTDEALALRQQLTRTSAELTAVVSTKRALQSQVTELKMDIFRLQKDKETLERTNTRVQDTLASSQELLRAMTTELDDTKRRCAAAESLCEKLRAANVEAVAAERLRSDGLHGHAKPSDGAAVGQQSAALRTEVMTTSEADNAVVASRSDAATQPGTTAAAPLSAAGGGPALTRGQTLRIFKQLKKGGRRGRGGGGSLTGRRTPRLVVSEAYSSGGTRRRDSFETRRADDEEDSSLSDPAQLDALKDTVVRNSGRVEWRGDPRAPMKRFSQSYDLSSISDEEDLSDDDDYYGEDDGYVAFDYCDDEEARDDGDREAGDEGSEHLRQNSSRVEDDHESAQTDRQTSRDVSSGKDRQRHHHEGENESSVREEDPENESPRAARSPTSDWRKKFADTYRENDGSLS